MSMNSEINNSKNLNQNNFNKKQEMRLININGIQPKKYTRNYIRTAKYNWYYLIKFKKI